MAIKIECMLQVSALLASVKPLQGHFDASNWLPPLTAPQECMIDYDHMASPHHLKNAYPTVYRVHCLSLRPFQHSAGCAGMNSTDVATRGYEYPNLMPY